MVDELIEATLVDLVRRLVDDVTYVSKFVERRALGILTRFLPRQERMGGDPLASAQSRYARGLTVNSNNAIACAFVAMCVHELPFADVR